MIASPALVLALPVLAGRYGGQGSKTIRTVAIEFSRHATAAAPRPPGLPITCPAVLDAFLRGGPTRASEITGRARFSSAWRWLMSITTPAMELGRATKRPTDPAVGLFTR